MRRVAQVILLHRFLNDGDVAPPGLEAAFAAALHAQAASHHAAVERALDWVIAMCAAHCCPACAVAPICAHACYAFLAGTTGAAKQVLTQVR